MVVNLHLANFEGREIMDREEIVLAALAPANGGKFSPVQVQKLLFLIDRNIPEEVDGPHFDFQPYHYGPFDSNVYQVLEELVEEGDVEVTLPIGQCCRSYCLTPQGQEKGDDLLRTLGEVGRQYIIEISNFVRRLPFAQLVSAIYNAYPEMKEHSVFKE